jgi:maleate cis-trans isomerase
MIHKRRHEDKCRHAVVYTKTRVIRGVQARVDKRRTLINTPYLPHINIKERESYLLSTLRLYASNGGLIGVDKILSTHVCTST